MVACAWKWRARTWPTLWAEFILFSAESLEFTHQRADMHDYPERRVFAQPRHDVVICARCTGPARLAHLACARDETHVRDNVMSCVAHAIARPVTQCRGAHTLRTRHHAPADEPVMRTVLRKFNPMPKRVVAMS
jgi:hypothetical protein